MALTDTNPTENTFDEQSSSNYNPLLGEAPIQKEYQKANIDPTSVPDFIPEQQFSKPVIAFDANASENEVNKNASHSESQKSTQEPFNPAVNDLSKSEKRAGAILVAEQAISAYGFVCNKIFVPLASVNEKKLNEMIAEGDIDPNIEFQLDASGNTATPRVFAHEWNETVAESLGMDEDFVERVREPLIRICEKRGFAITDEQYLGIEVGKDLITKSAIAWDLRKSANNILEQLKNNTIAIKNQNQPIAKPQPQPSEPKEEKQEPIIVPVENKIEESQITSNKSTLTSNFAPAQEVANMPQFGNASILAHMAAEVAKDEVSDRKTQRNRQSSARQSSNKAVPKNNKKNPKPSN